MIAKKFLRGLLLVGLIFSLPALAELNDDAVAVANRDSGDLSLINTRTLKTLRVPLSLHGEDVEPMYVNHWHDGGDGSGNRVFIGDRANNRIIALNDVTYQVAGTIETGRGVFHQWVQPQGYQLWVVSDVDNTLSVINPWTMDQILRFPIPAELTAMGGKPHDVFVNDTYAYVTVTGVEGGNKLLRYNTWDFELSAQIDIAGGAHVFGQGNKLYVPSQSDEQLRVYRADTLKLLRTPEVPNAHGIVTSETAKHVYVTNIAEGGDNAIWALSKNGKKSFGSGDTWADTPHNIVLGSREKWLYATHSGENNNSVTVLKIRRRESPIAKATVEVGQNPFGLGLLKGAWPHEYESYYE